MKLGIVTPVLTRVPGTHAPWEATAGIDEVAHIAIKADELGFHHLTCSEHIGIPTEVAKVRGFTYWDPLSTFGNLAARTTAIQFVTYVVVLGYHHPMELVKRYGTLDRVSGGRLILGVGVGSLKEEFDLIGAQFEGRGARGDDAIRALRASFGEEMPEYHGEYYDYEGFVVEPHSIQTDMPIWVGGRTARSLRRAIELGDGWVPFGLSVGEMAAMLDQARATDAWAVRTTPLELALPSRGLDPVDDPDGTRATLERMASIGTTIVETRVKNHSLAHYLDQLSALQEIAAGV
jgi:probable F420-dependent oxidoreductase